MDKYTELETEKRKYTEAILNSDSGKKIIVAGPGTGKSSIFQEICRDNLKKGKTKNLVLSFINELVDDLRLDLHNLAEVKTLHSFALANIPKNKNIFMDLGLVIEDDYEIVYNKKIDYKKLLCNLIDSKDDLEFYSKRRKYYDHFGPDCSIYTLIKIFEQDKSKIPEYSQILIDEFQDFNKLEAKLIDLLSFKNPLLIVGDDDQSLYSFKHANPNEIRLKCKDGNYSFFELPFCFRCTEVIVNAFDSVVAKAKEKGFLKERLNKKYRYYSSPEKDKVSSENPKIIVKKEVYQKSVAYYIDQEIKTLFHPRQQRSVLIICSLKKQIPDLVERLHEKGFNNIQAPQKSEKLQLLDGFKLLLKNKECNLGWRIVAKYILSDRDKFNNIIKESHDKNEEVKFKDLLNKDIIDYVDSILITLNKINDNNKVFTDEYAKIIECFKYDHHAIVNEKLKNELDMEFGQKNIYSKVPIKITTILGSKGLTSDYVFFVNFDDKYILDKDKKITDENICKYLVALTRAKRRIYIYTGESRLPTFVEWTNNKFYEVVK
ncbi:MAG: UvrD-helicase domain-containing protein [Sedimentisphaerales bacterium]